MKKIIPPTSLIVLLVNFGIKCRVEIIAKIGKCGRQGGFL